ncbi:response regulator [Streptomyces sp. S063]|uniref:response regulator n=1 Tax=Streptomyces sp. S063 TaxID=2005885 RepID=UPI00100829AF|nr:response regulator transcription factor [Streptomyces sp. S063]
MTIRVVVADDQELVRSGFAMILDAQPGIEVVAEAGDGAQAVAAVGRFGADIALLDIRMPVLDGIAACREIAASGACRTIMLTTFDADEYVYEALHAGASGFLLKDVRRDDLVHAVRVVAAGESLVAPSVARRLIAEYTARPAGRPAPSAGRLEVLTARERETLLHLARGLSNAEIAAALVVSEHTVKTHVGHVLAKLGLRDRIQAVICAYETGLVAPSDGGATVAPSPGRGSRTPAQDRPGG